MATILIADDRATNRHFLVTLLGYMGHRLLEAADGLDALAQLETERPDLMIVDIVMPRMDGVELVRQLTEKLDYNPQAIIFYTATYRLTEAQPIADELGIQYLMQKPASPEEILQTINAALANVEVTPDESAPVPVATDEAEAAEHFTQELSQHNLHIRLAAIIDLTFDLEMETEADSVILTACRAARTIVKASYCGLGILDSDGESFQRFAGDQAGAVTYDSLPVPRVDLPILARSLKERKFTWLRAGDVQHADLFESVSELLPAGAPPAQAVMVVPIQDALTVEGCLYVVFAEESPAFADEDQRILETLAGFVAIIYDRIRAQEYEEQLTAELKRSNEELEQFASVIAHDLKAPIRSLHGFTEILEEQSSDELNEKARQAVAYIRESSQQLRRCIDDLLSFARVTTGLPESDGYADTNTVLATVLANLRSQMDETGAVVTADPLPNLRFNATLLTQLLQNLIDNAIKYRGDQNPQIHVSAIEHSNAHEISVEDNGIGIPERHRDRVFQLFKRLHSEETHPGRGLGLAICKKIVELRGGRIRVEASRLGGSCFRFTIPRVSGRS